MGAAADDTDTAARLAQKLRAALVQEEPRWAGAEVWVVPPKPQLG